jgi:hypothetical protein
MISCKKYHKGGLNTYWIKADNFDSFDEIDSTFTGTGVTRHIRSSGCRLAVPNQWYWMGFVATHTTATECTLNSTLRAVGAPDNGDCGGSPGTNMWDVILPLGETVFVEDSSFNLALTHGYGQFYGLTEGDYHFDGKDMSQFIKGLKYWDGRPYYYNHWGPTLSGNWKNHNSLTISEWGERMTRH